MHTLHLRNLSKRFGNTNAVDGVSLSVPSGSFVGIIGRSGAGKSTLLRMINRLNEPSAGTIEFEGTVVTHLQGQDLRQWRRNCAMDSWPGIRSSLSGMGWVSGPGRVQRIMGRFRPFSLALAMAMS